MRKVITHVGGIPIKEHRNIHRWIHYHYGEAPFCANPDCKNLDAWKFQWALLRGKEYARDVSNFIPLCAKCHVSYDRNKTKEAEILRTYLASL